jgi:phage terminase large subunit-like protein
MSSTIEMGTRQIIGSPTLSARAKQATHESIPQAIPTAQASHSQNRMCNAPTVDVFLFGDQGSKSNCVSPASINGQNLNGRPQNPAIIVESNSSRGLEITAASVVSTWEAVGSAEVFDLGIEGEPEFFANGLLSHNCDEVAAWRYREAWDQAMLGLRLGDKPQCVVTTTPRPTDLIKRLATAKTTHLTTGSTYDNKANLAGAFLEQIVTRYEGTRLGRQELNAEILDDNPGALWKRDWIDRSRLSLAPDMARIVVGVDPAVTSNDDSDLTGVVVAGMDRQNPPHYYVLADYSRIATPDSWAQSVINAYHQHGADRIVAEVNNGGDLVGTIIRQKDANCAYTAVRATRGKQLRAEPIASLYEQDRVHHVGSIPELEDQMLGWDPISSDKSPDRLDALVWALTELSTPVPGAGFLAWMEQQAKR